MPRKRDEYPPEVYQVRIALLGIQPEIWRRILVPPEMTLRRFSDAIQIAMGWGGHHLHEFRAGMEIFGQPDEDSDPYGITRRQDDRKVALRAMLPTTQTEAFYTYDFGDDWQHSIVLEKRLKPDPAVRYPVCIDGEMACPPDDCGGPPGYSELVASRQVDPTAFSLDVVNRALRRRHWPTRP
jgi:hypothetical protein